MWRHAAYGAQHTIRAKSKRRTLALSRLMLWTDANPQRRLRAAGATAACPRGRGDDQHGKRESRRVTATSSANKAGSLYMNGRGILYDVRLQQLRE